MGAQQNSMGVPCKPRKLFYYFGKWGYHTDACAGQMMAGFSPKPPGLEMCGYYKIMFVGALQEPITRKGEDGTPKILLGQQPRLGPIVIEESAGALTVRTGDWRWQCYWSSHI